MVCSQDIYMFQWAEYTHVTDDTKVLNTEPDELLVRPGVQTSKWNAALLL